jgi:tetratricopeptide (TPR) repeat protein
MSIGWRGLLAGLALTLAVPVAQADDWADCTNSDGDVRIRIRGCTTIIDASASTKKQLGVAFNNRGAAFHMTGDLDLAIEDFNLAIFIDPKKASAYYNRGHIYRGKGDVNAAIKDYERAIALNPKYAIYRQSSCWMQAEIGTDLKRARAACDASLALENHPITLNSRGLVGLKQGLFDKAWADSDAALKIKPELASALYGRGIAALRLGRTAEGNADLAAATKLDGKIAEEYAGYGVRP